MEFVTLCVLLSLAFKTGLAIYGGEFAEIGEFPHQVQLYYDSKFICGGSILSLNLIITAAYCIHDLEMEKIVVVAGANKLKHNIHKDYPKFIQLYQQILPLKDYYEHAKFNKSGNYENNIAILLLNLPFELSKGVKSISLLEKNETLRFLNSTTGVVVGWGQTKNGKLSTRLKKLSLNLGDDKRCKPFSSKRHRTNWFVRRNEICLRPSSGEGVCPGDNGGPLICQKWDSKLNTSVSVLCGISSKSAGDSDADCGDDLVFMNVAEFRDWIDQTISRIKTRLLCTRGHFYCAFNHTCLHNRFICDKKADCLGGDDEMDCENYESCAEEQFRCKNGKCIGKVETCDGTFDCEDMPGTRSSSDEEKCPKTCKYETGLHDCGENDRYVSKTWVCNGIVDCLNGSDEWNCSGELKSTSTPKPSISKNTWAHFLKTKLTELIRGRGW